MFADLRLVNRNFADEAISKWISDSAVGSYNSKQGLRRGCPSKRVLPEAADLQKNAPKKKRIIL